MGLEPYLDKIHLGYVVTRDIVSLSGLRSRSSCHCHFEGPVSPDQGCAALERLLERQLDREPLVCPAPAGFGLGGLALALIFLALFGGACGALGYWVGRRRPEVLQHFSVPIRRQDTPDSENSAASPVTPATLRRLKDGAASARHP